MKFQKAKKLHNEDEVTIKKTKQILTVVETIVTDKTVIVLCDDGNEYHHKDIK